MSLLRHGLRLRLSPAVSHLSPTIPAVTKFTLRAYSSKKAKHTHAERATMSGSKRGPITTASLTPGSQQVLSDPEEHARASAAMASSVEWFRREVAQLESR